jgi:hypothetical protein
MYQLNHLTNKIGMNYFNLTSKIIIRNNSKYQPLITINNLNIIKYLKIFMTTNLARINNCKINKNYFLIQLITFNYIKIIMRR